MFFKTLAGYGDFSRLWKGDGLSRALEVANRMIQESTPIPKEFIRSILQGCLKTRDLAAAKQVHSLMVCTGLNLNGCLSEDLIRVFASCGRLPEALCIFAALPDPSLYAWNTIIAAHAKLGTDDCALDLYAKMCQAGVVPDKVTFLSTLKACANAGAVHKGMQIHVSLIENESCVDIILASAMVDMYAKCRWLVDARAVFNQLPNHDVVMWGAMIAGYAEHGDSYQALELYTRMQQESKKPNLIIFSSVLKACGIRQCTGQGRLIHDQILRAGLQIDTILGNALVDMYVKCNSLQEARKVFTNLPLQDVVSWGALISGYVQSGDGLSALELFDEMQEKGMLLDDVIVLCLLKACSCLGATVHGRLVHDIVMRSELTSNLVVGTALLDMYAKCGSLDEAIGVFNMLPHQNVVAWGAIVAGFAESGRWTRALQWFMNMLAYGLCPDGVSYAGVLNACSHAGLLTEGYQYFKSMIREHNINPNIDHYSCMVDLLGRAGKLHEAEGLLKSMPIQVDPIQWTSLLTSCKTYGNMKLAKKCFQQLLQMDSGDASGYTLMSNIYADTHMWKDAEGVQKLRKDMCAVKKPGKAWIEVKEKPQEFVVADDGVAKVEGEFGRFRMLNRVLKKQGYVPQVDSVVEQST